MASWPRLMLAAGFGSPSGLLAHVLSSRAPRRWRQGQPPHPMRRGAVCPARGHVPAYVGDLWLCRRWPASAGLAVPGAHIASALTVIIYFWRTGASSRPLFGSLGHLLAAPRGDADGVGYADGLVIAMAKGKRPTLIGVSAVLVAVRIGVTVPSSLAT